jgi:hypothetical protein
LGEVRRGLFSNSSSQKFSQSFSLLYAFHKTKSDACSFSYSSLSTLADSFNPFKSILANLPYLGDLEILK